MNMAVESIKKQNEKLAAMAAELLPQIRKFNKLARQIEDEVDHVTDKYDRILMREENRELEKVIDKLFALGDKAESICQKVYRAF